MRKYKIMLILLFTTLIGIGMVTTLVIPDEETSILENRELAQTPSFTMAKFMNGSYQEKLETSLNDQFIMRDEWARLSINLQAWMGKKEINQVYLGKEGYLLEQSKPEEYDTTQIQENEEILAGFLNDMTKQFGKKHVSCLMIPSKTDVMTEKLPAYVSLPKSNSTVEEIKGKMDEPDELIDLQETLQAHQKEYIYYRTDHHWTTLGAYYAYETWCSQLGDKADELASYEREQKYTDFYGTTYNKAQVSVTPDTLELFHTKGEKSVQVDFDDGELMSDSIYFPEVAVKGFNRYDIFFSKNTFKVNITTRANTGKTLLVIKDSFANCFVPFLLNQYDKIVMIDYRYGKVPIGQVIREAGSVTDVLVMFNTEKFMQNTKLSKLGDTRVESTLKEFDMDDLLK